MVVQEKSERMIKNEKIIGSGETTIVLAHGFGGDQSVWEYIVPELAEKFRVVVFDWNFQGAVYRHGTLENSKQDFVFEAFSDDLISLIDSMALKNVFFVGHSMSGVIGCLAAVKRHGLFRRLLLLCASPRYLNSNDYEGGFEMPQVEALLSTIESNFQPWARCFAGLAVGPDHPSEAAKFCKTLQSMGSDVALSIAREVFLSDFRHLLERVEVPCTIVNGPRDFVVPAFVPLYMQTKFKGEASLELIDFDGHFPQFTAPRLLADVITRSYDL